MSKEFTARPATIQQFMSGFVANAPAQPSAAQYATVRRDYVAPKATPEANTETRIVSGGYVQHNYSNPSPSHPSPAYRHEQKPKSKRGLIIALSALATILVLGLAAWGVIAYTSGGGKHKGSSDKDDTSLQYAIDSDDFKLLKKYADRDSARAFYPLAVIYEDKGDYDEALKWAKAALYSTDLSDSEQRKANKLVEKLSKAIEAITLAWQQVKKH